MLAWVFRRALMSYPREFRGRFGAAMERAFFDQVHARRATRGVLAAAILAVRSIVNAAATGLAERRDVRRSGQERRASRPSEPLRTLTQDLRFSLRMIRRQPLVTTLSIATLAAGIGSASAVFSLVDASLVRELPLPAADKLVAVMETVKQSPSQVSWENFADWKRQARTFAALTPFRAQSVNLTGLDRPDRVRGGFVTSDFFTLVAVAPERGRSLRPDDDLPNAPPVAVISYGMWSRQLGSDAGVIGRVVLLNNIAFTVVGVMPQSFRFPYDGADAWVPIQFFPGTRNRGVRSLTVFGRLAPATTMSQAQAELDTIAASLERAYPATNTGRGATVQPMHDWLSAGGRDQLTVIFALVLVLLAAASANVASLQIGATISRRQEIAIRTALGAGRTRIVRQLFTEHLLMAAVAGLIGLVLARVLVAWTVRSPVPIFGLERAGVDARVGLFIVVATLAAGLVSGLLPALQWLRQAPAGHAPRPETSSSAS